MIDIRPFARADAVHLPDIERSAGQLFKTLPDLAWIASDEVMSAQQHIDVMDRGFCWVASDADGQQIAFLSAETLGDALHIWEISVHADAQGRGVGRALIEHAARYALSAGLKALTLTTFRAVAWNEPYYHRLGFETLSKKRLGGNLTAILNDERGRGLPVDRRCAMRRMLALAPDAV
jgi:GNAT superfamily N-acetyltransferase